MRKPAYMIEVNSKIFYMDKVHRRPWNRLFCIKNGAGDSIYFGSRNQCFHELKNIEFRNNVFNRFTAKGLGV